MTNPHFPNTMCLASLPKGKRDRCIRAASRRQVHEQHERASQLRNLSVDHGLLPFDFFGPVEKQQIMFPVVIDSLLKPKRENQQLGKFKGRMPCGRLITLLPALAAEDVGPVHLAPQALPDLGGHQHGKQHAGPRSQTIQQSQTRFDI